MEIPRAILRIGLWVFLAYGVAAELLPFLVMVASLDMGSLGSVMHGPWPAIAACSIMLLLVVLRPAWFGEMEPRLVAMSAGLATVLAAVIGGLNYFTRDVGVFDFFAFFFCVIYLAHRTGLSKQS